MIVTARTALFVWLLAITAAAAVPVTCAVWSSRPPEPPGPCVDSMEVRQSHESRYSCAPGARLEVYPMQYGQHLVKCVCLPPRPPAAPVDAAAP